MQIRSWITSKALAAYGRIFREQPSAQMAGFLKNLSWSFVGVMISAALLFVVSITAGRVLGPKEFGYYSILIVIANAVAVFSNFGFDQASLKYIAGTSDETKRSAYFSNSVQVVFGLLIAAAVIVGGLRVFAPSLTGELPAQLFVFAVAYAAIMALRQIGDAYIRAVGLFRMQAGVKVVEAAATLVLFVTAFFILGMHGYVPYIAAIGIAGLLTILLYAKSILSRAKLQKWDWDAFKEMRGYAFHGVYISIVGIALSNIDRFFLNSSLGTAEVGLYAAYMLVPSALAGYFSTAFVNVFFPMMSKIPDKAVVIRKLDKATLAAALPMLALYYGFGFFVLKLLGGAYRFEPLYLFLTSLYGLFLIYIAMLAAVVGSSTKMYKRYAKFLAIKLVILLAVYLALRQFDLVQIPVLILVLIFGLVVDTILFRMSLEPTKK